MNKMDKPAFLIILSAILMFFSMLFSCQGESVETSKLNTSADTENVGTDLVSFRGKVFNVPSHTQAADYIRRSQTNYNSELANDAGRAKSYATKFKQAVNLGVYSADLSYITAYEQFNHGRQHYLALKYLIQDLDINTPTIQSFFSEIESKSRNKDSLIAVLSKAYSNIDEFLIENKRDNIASFIIAGSWTESLYLLVNTDSALVSEETRKYIADQKYPLENLISLLKPHYGVSPETDAYIDKLIELAFLYDAITYKYKFVEPLTDTNNNHTLIKSENTALFYDYQIKKVKQKINALRQMIVDYE